jgi:hypothetical protein
VENKIPEIFFKEYFNQLSPKTFYFLCKLYQHDSLHYQDDLKTKIFDTHQEMETACSELIANNIVMYEKIYNKKKGYVKYTLSYLQEDKIFEILYNVNVRKKSHNVSEKYIENILAKFSDRVRDKLKKLIEGTIIYYSKFRSTIKTKLIYDLLLPFFDVQDNLISKTCDICANDKHYGKRPIQYIHVILKNLKEDKKAVSFKDEGLDYFRQKKEEGDKRFGVKIASGKVDDNIAYKAILQCKDFKELNRLYKMGVRILKEEGKEIVIYDWCKI